MTQQGQRKKQDTKHVLFNDEQDLCEYAMEKFSRCQTVILGNIFLALSPTHGTFLYGNWVDLLFFIQIIVQIHVYSF